MKKKTLLLLLALTATLCQAQKRMVLIDQDGAGPGGSDQMSMLALLQAPQVEVLGITIVTGVTHGATRRLCTPCACWS